MAPSPASSCVSSDEEEAAAAKAMVVAGCPRCLIPVLLQFLHGADANTANANADANTNMHGGKS
ncbi:hypothetical protein TRIUR3_16560 [Triticum urartu]|uniref:Uncharacterized protein n=1 Tax=Triticum urartu TaxID=4572 RepID=M7ZRA0_TRIUA|nr:hypothetical protein TRIUR3_16560 [Triticum urartu]